MTDSTVIELYQAHSEAELATLRTRWSEGKLERFSGQLRSFAEEQRERIRDRAEDLADPSALINATKILVIELGAVHYPSEMQDQMKEIHDYIWYHGERGEYDRDRIAHDWARCHAANWRRWRLKEYLFVIDQQADEIIKRISNN